MYEDACTSVVATLAPDLQKWSNKLESECDSPDELKLARTVFDDFCGQVSAGDTSTVTTGYARAVALKEAGNTHFKAGRFSAAADIYREALESLSLSEVSCGDGDGSGGQDSRQLAVLLRVNCANALWKLFLKNDGAVLDEIQCMCTEALKLQTGSPKALYRLVHCFLAKGDVSAAWDLVSKEGLAASLSDSSGESGQLREESNDRKEMFRKLTFQVLAIKLKVEPHSVQFKSPVLMGRVVSALLQRSGADDSAIQHLLQHAPPAQSKEANSIVGEPSSEESTHKSKSRAGHTKQWKELQSASKAVVDAFSRRVVAAEGNSAAGWVLPSECELLNRVLKVGHLSRRVLCVFSLPKFGLRQCPRVRSLPVCSLLTLLLLLGCFLCSVSSYVSVCFGRIWWLKCFKLSSSQSPWSCRSFAMQSCWPLHPTIRVATNSVRVRML